MEKIMVFVNFTGASQRAVEQSISLAKLNHSVISICHISSDSTQNDESVKLKMKPYLEQVQAAGLQAEMVLEYGSFFDVAADVAKKVNPDLVVAGTIGVEGFDLRFLGSAIYKFVRELPYTSLVIQADSLATSGGYKKIMLPISAHANFMKKVLETTKVLDKEGEIIVFKIEKEGEELDNAIKVNLEKTEAYLSENGIKWKLMTSSSSKFGNRFAQETLSKVQEHGMDLISLSADVSMRNKHFGKMHKEDILLNNIGIPVLCINTDK